MRLFIRSERGPKRFSAPTPYLYLTAGQQEPLLEPIVRFANLAETRHFNVEIHTLPGIHDWTQWDAQIPGCFDSLLSHLSPSS